MAYFRIGVIRRVVAAGALAATAACSGSSAAPAPGTQFPPSTVAALNAALASWFGTYKPPGVIVGVWVPGRGTYITARGKADLKTGEAMQLDDHVRIGSITKTFTATVLLQLVDAKIIGLDDPVSKYLSYIPGGRRMTLRMLANMTAGLYNYTQDKRFQQALLKDPNRVWTPRQLVDVGLRHPVDFPPGTGWNYSNTNSVVLGIILEQVTKKNIAAVFKAKSFDPLDLANTVWPIGGALPTPYAHGITTQTLDGKTADATHWNPSWAFTAGELISTLNDLRVWVKAYTTGAQISAALQRERLRWVKFPPLTPQKTYGIGIVYDEGWLGHEGSLPGYNSTGYYLPAQDATLVILVNSDIGHEGKSPALALFQSIAKIVTPNNVPI